MRLRYLKVLMWKVLAEKKSITIRILPPYATQVNVAVICMLQNQGHLVLLCNTLTTIFLEFLQCCLKKENDVMI